MNNLSISSAAVVVAFRDQNVALPLRLSDEDIGVILDDDGVDVVTVDVNGDRPNAQANAIAMMIISAVNHLAGLDPVASSSKGAADE